MKCGKGTSSPRFTRKSQNENERALFTHYWQEITALYGTYVDYFTYDYQLSAHDYFYGEQPLAPYVVPPKGFPILAEFQNDSLLLAKFGIQTESDVTFIVPIETFYDQFGYYSEPKAGDLIRMTELGWDRPGGMEDVDRPSTPPLTACEDIENNPFEGICADGLVDDVAGCNVDGDALSGYDDPETFEKLIRGAAVYEITERRDENLTLNYNMLQGHYVWILHGKRFDYSYQPNAPREPGSMKVSDETQYGLISSAIGNVGWPPATETPYPEDVKELPKNYPDNVDEEADENFDYDANPESDDSIYGGY